MKQQTKQSPYVKVHALDPVYKQRYILETSDGCCHDVQTDSDLMNLIARKEIIPLNVQIINGKIEFRAPDNVFFNKQGITLVRTAKLKDGTYKLINTMGDLTRAMTSEEVKSRIIGKQINTIDLQIDKSNRLVSKKVEYSKLCKTDPTEWEDIEKVVFYGLARINQLTPQRKQQYINMIKSMDTMDESQLVSLFTDNMNWNIYRYRFSDTACRDKIIDLMCEIAKI